MTLFVFLQINVKRAFLDSKVQKEEMSIHTRGVTICLFVLNRSVINTPLSQHVMALGPRGTEFCRQIGSGSFWPLCFM